MTYEEFDNLLSGLSSMATIGALVIGAVWTYRRFVRTREANPKIDFLVDIEFVMHQSGVWAAEALAFVENKGLVRHDISSFTYDIRYFLKDDTLDSNGDFSLFVPHKMDEGSWLPKTWAGTFVEPGLRTRYSTLVRIPVDASAVLIHGKFLYTNSCWHTADKLVKVPERR